MNLFAETKSFTITFSLEDFTFAKQNTYNVINPPKNNNYVFTTGIGEPQLPVKIINLSIPFDKEIDEVKIVSHEAEILKGEFLLFPVQQPKILSDDSPYEFITPDPAVYEKRGNYPENIIQKGKSGFLAGYHIGSILVIPFQYDPVNRELTFITELEVEITYAESKKTVVAINQRSTTAQEFLNNQLSNIIYNKSDIHKPNITYKKQKDDIYEYVIITSDNFTADFQPLADWKTQKGMSASIVSTSYIYDNYDGIDNAEKLRNFIKDYYQNHGTLWVLLGGDTNFVPYREAFAFDCECGAYWHNFLPCDLYFSDLDGTWNDNGNDVYGELEDNIDMYPDVFVGRASVETSAEAVAFVDKILTYEKNPPIDYQLDMMFLASVLWSDPYTDSGLSKNFIDDTYVPDRFDPITKLYQSMGNLYYDDVMTNLNEGQHIINHNGHAWYSVMGIGSDHLYNSDMDALTNAPAFSIWFTIGCWPAAFDYNCIAEHWINNPNGGGVAFIGNSRYGWGSPGNPLYGYSDTFDQEFYKQLFVENIHSIGMTMALAKSVYVLYARNENVFRWCEYEINLLGDPEMPVWTDIPQNLLVSHPDSITVGNCDMTVTVKDGANPLQNALVCIMQEDDDVYQTAYTDLQGEVQFSVSTGNVIDDLLVTVTAQNFLPYQNTIKVIADQPYVMIDSYATNNSIHGYITPGANVSIDAGFHNFGQMPADSIEIILFTDSDLITMIDSTYFISHLEPKTALFVDDVFSFFADSTLASGTVIPINYIITDSSGSSWDGSLSVTGALPKIEYIYYEVWDSLSGNGNGIPEQRELVHPHLIVKNTGLVPSLNTIVTAQTDCPDITIPSTVWTIGDISASQCTEVVIEFSISQNYTPPVFADIELNFTDSLCYTCIDTFVFTIGETGFFDTMEEGDDKWTHWGTDDLWHLTDRKAFSGNYSWYCGMDDSLHYPDDVQEVLESITFPIGKSPTLSFWCCYEFTNYGVDGIYVEVFDGYGWITLDFIGSGGALPVLTTQNDWLEYEYELSFIPAGTESQLRFRFVSDDEDFAEGVYIDDVKVYTNNCPVHADFIADAFYGQLPFTVQFYQRAFAETGPIIAWDWDFGDGYFSYQTNPQHIYNEDGLKTVTLLVADQFGITSTITKANYIHVLPDTTKTVYVNPDSTGDFTTISEGLDALNAGDTLLLADGIYTGPMNKELVIPKDNITIRSENGVSYCCLDGENSGTAFMLGFHENIFIEGIAFENFDNNGYGGAISANGSFTINNCTFYNCTSSYDGGAIWSVNSAEVSIANSLFEDCNADEGGALFAEFIGDLFLDNTIFMNCESNEFSGGAAYLKDVSFIEVSGCIFDECEVLTVGEGGAMYFTAVDTIMVKSSSFSHCVAVSSGGGLYFNECQSVKIDSCAFGSNISQNGGALKSNVSNLTISQTRIFSNEAIVGAGIYCGDDSFVSVDDCLFYENSSDGTNSKGGAFYINDSEVEIFNTTIANNNVNNQGGGISHLGTKTLGIYNSIFWDNAPQDVWSTDTTKVTISYCDLSDYWAGTGNLSLNPDFADTTNHDYHLTEESPCIDTGSNFYVHSFADLDGNVRVWDGTGSGYDIVDMGCYEFGAPIYKVDEDIPEENNLTILKNFPNPFNDKTTISFYLPNSKKATI
ncbi:MAG: C25 family cysteine peptidase, partial [Candidatus Celaenobacter polaris]|nr:C25 family cysteine peptidase [Candidatus Celaenobacter polaris]